MKETKKIFQREYARRLESEGKNRTRQRLQRILSFFGKTANLILLLAASVLIGLAWQQRIATPYLSSLRAVGGDYFNALTYANFFAKYHPLPTTGWMPFWNEGLPVIGGYPTFFFYLMLPLTRFFDVPTSMELASIVLILLYLIASHFLFWETTRNHLIALLFTGIILVTPATYYSLVAEGLFVGSAVQWLLPTTFFFLIRFLKFQERVMLIAAATATGIALITHPAVAAATILIPAIIFISVADTGDPKDAIHTQQLRLIKLSLWEKLTRKTSHLFLFSLIALTVGSIGVYTLVVQLLFSGSAGLCDSQQCWGQYPQHLILWLSPLLALPIVFLPAAIAALRIHKGRANELLAPLAALSPILLYVILAYFHKIDSFASAFFPRRLFWAISLLFLMSAGIAFRFSSRASAKLAVITLSIFLVAISLTVPLLPKAINFSIQDQLKIPNSLPMGVETWIVPKYQTLPRSEILPSWLPLDDQNWRIDSIRPDFFVWWNTVAQLPQTRGYSNAPLKEHLDWLYYLQTSTLIPKNPDELSVETRKNRALFLLDSFAVRFLQQPTASIIYEGIAYDPLILTDKTLIKRSERVLTWSFVELSTSLITPIVTPTNATRVLVISNQEGYETLMRAISLENLNSTIILPIQGPPSIDKLSQAMLDNVEAVILYQFTGSKWNRLEAFVENGGKLFLDIGSLDKLPSVVPKLFGAKSLQVFDQERLWKTTATPSKLLKETNPDRFSPLMFGENPWRIIAPTSSKFLASWMKPILTQNDAPILASGTFGKGIVTFSGFNLPYHIVNYQNEAEAKLLKNIFLSFTEETHPIGQYSYKRPSPTAITVASSGAKGIYFKENYHPGWKAVVNGQRTQVFKAGLGFMYIPIPPKDQSQTSVITLDFKGSPATWGFPILSAISFILALLYGLTSAPFGAIEKIFRKVMVRRLESWWARD